MALDVNTEQLGDEAYMIALAGEVDVSTAPEFKKRRLEVIGQGSKEVVVDLTQTTYGERLHAYQGRVFTIYPTRAEGLAALSAS